MVVNNYPNQQLLQVPKQLGTFGAATLQLPMEPLIEEFMDRFLMDVVSHLNALNVPIDLVLEREAAELQDDVLSLRDWFPDIDGKPIHFDGSLQQLRKLATQAIEIANEAGAWKDDRAALDELKAEVVGELTSKIHRHCRYLQKMKGNRTSQRFLRHVIEEIEGITSQLQAPEFTVHQTKRLLMISKLLKQRTTPTGLWKRWIASIFPWTPHSWLLTSQQKKEINLVIVEITQSTTRRQQQNRIAVIQSVYESLIGSKGTLIQLQHNLKRQQEFFNELAASFRSDHSLAPPADSTQLHLVESIDTKLNHRDNHTVYHLMLALTRQAGISPIKVAKSLFRNGLVVGDKRMPHIDWSRVGINTIRAALKQKVAKLLGVDDLSLRPNLSQPQTAYDYLATMTPAHPWLRERLRIMTKTLVQRSLPYAEFDGNADTPMMSHAVLFCHPQQRSALSGLLRTQLKLTSTDSLKSFDLRNPYRIELRQDVYGASAGDCLNYLRCMSSGNRALAANIVEPLFDRYSTYEIRQLNQQLHHTDCESLFAAGCLTKVIYQVANDRYALAVNDPRINDLFAQPVYTPAWLPAQAFRDELIRNLSFKTFLQQTYSHITDLSIQLEQLCRDSSPQEVCRSLVNMGVLIEESTDYCLSLCFQKKTSEMPLRFYQRCEQPVQGLARRDFVAAMKTSRVLSTILAYRVLDRYERGELQQTDTPEFILKISAKLQQRR